ncbi:hypothetical protein [Acinetobacter indicus]|uniref:hypothetical protein n=1 Tax=Acinetobacter indicus TaxID=756892 RepID=UPI000CECA8E2|nr:hypothetical protein [Acinetobacter indicus]
MKSVGQPKKNIIDALQTIFWYRYLETRIVANIFDEEFSEFCLKNKIDITSLEVEDRISLLENFQSSKLNSKEITFYQTNPNKIGHSLNQADSRIWYKYSKGETKPNPVKLERIDAIVENSSLYFNHPIWDFLKIRPATRSYLENFLSKFEDVSIKAIHNKTIIEPTLFNENVHLDESEFLKYGNILDFYSYILYAYHKARFDLDLEKMDNCIAFFISNLKPILANLCLEGIFFLKLCQIHLQPYKSSKFENFEIFDHFKMCEYLTEIQNHLKNENNTYELLDTLSKEFLLD